MSGKVRIDRDETIKLTAALIAGLQVPVSIFPQPKIILGAGYDAWSELKDGLVGFGWTDVESVEHALREVLMSEGG